jgi:kynurenine formamidase
MSMGDASIREELLALSNWGRWGVDDRVGTLNHQSGASRARALGLPVKGETISLCHEIRSHPGRSQRLADEWFDVVYSELVRSPQELTELVGMVFHGVRITHVDAPGHVPFEGRTYPGVKVTIESGRLDVGDVSPLSAGVLGRGLLLDVSESTGGAYLPDGYEITSDDLDRAAELVARPEAGDIILVRTGNLARIAAGGAWDRPPGPGLSVADWLRHHEASVFGSDTPNEGLPDDPEFGYRFHVATLSLMGLWLIDNMNLDDLATACAKSAKWQFLLVMGPLALRGMSGAPVNPLAIV